MSIVKPADIWISEGVSANLPELVRALVSTQPRLVFQTSETFQIAISGCLASAENSYFITHPSYFFMLPPPRKEPPGDHEAVQGESDGDRPPDAMGGGNNMARHVNGQRDLDTP